MKAKNTLIIAGTLIVLALITAITLSYSLNPSENPTLTSQGTSTIEVTPDIISTNLYIKINKPTAQEAQEEVREIQEDLLYELYKLGIEKEDIELTNYNVYPEYQWINGNRIPKGFTANQNIIVSVTNLNKVLQIVDKGIETGALVSYINFELSPELKSQYKQQALKEAGQNAQAKAQATAEGLNKKLGELVSVQSQDFNYVPYRYFDSAEITGATAEKAIEFAANISPRELEVSANLIVEYELR